MRETTASLLFRHDEGPTSLSVDSVENDSEFSRLISVSHISSNRPNFGRDAQSDFFVSTDISVPDRNRLQFLNRQRDTEVCFINQKYNFTLVTGTCNALHLCFTWISLLNGTWSETVLIIKTSLPYVQEQRLSVCFINILTIFQELQSSKNAVVTVLVPCLFAVFLPVWMNGVPVIQPYSFGALRSNVSSLVFQNILEILVRCSMTVLVVVLCIALSHHYIALQWTNTAVTVQTKLSDGLGLNIIGTAFAIISTIVFRSSLSNDERRLNSQDGTPTASQPNSKNSPDTFVEIDCPTTIQILEDAILLEPFAIETDAPYRSPDWHDSVNSSVRQTPLPFWKMLLVFQSGLFSILLIVPAFFLPAIRFEYSGIASRLMSSRIHSFTLYHFPLTFYRDSLSAATPLWIVSLVFILVLSFAVVCPIFAIATAILTWAIPPRCDVVSSQSSWTRQRCRKWLNAIHPAVGSFFFSLSLLVGIYSIQHMDAFTLTNSNAENSSEKGNAICRFFGKNEIECLVVSSTVGTGAFVYVGQSILLECFIILTLMWS
jgi:hypothetical protein